MKQTESNFQQTVIDFAHLTGWRAVHFRGVRVQRKDGSIYYQTPVQADSKGLPDLILVRERVVWAELKVGKGKLTPEQVDWLDALTAAGQECYIWYPSDWDEIEKVLTTEINRREP